MSVDNDHLGKSQKRYYWLAFVIGGMVAGLLGCVVYSYIIQYRHVLLSDGTGNPKADKPIVQTALTVQESESPSVFLGVEIISVDAVIAEQLDLETPSGVLVNGVVDNSPAQEAGVQRGDVILALNNIPVMDVDGFRAIVAELNPGDNVRITYIRDGGKDTVCAILADASVALEIAQDSDADDDWGVSLTVLNSALRDSLDIPGDIDGIVILSVTPGGLADEAGLLPGDVITGINNAPITDMSDFFVALSSDEDGTALLDVYTQGTLRYVALDSSGIAETIAQSQPSFLDKIISIFTDDDNVILASEHENEEDDYEKPVCKRLEEEGERYDE